MTDPELRRLREIEQRLRSITEHAPDFILQFDRAGIINYMNRPAPGHTMQDMLGTDVRRWMEPQFHEAFGRAVDEVFDTQQLSSYESVGSVTGRHYVNRISPVLADGKVVSAILITHDITEIKRAQEAARESEQRYRSLVDGSFEGLAISVDRVFLDGNRAVADMFGYTLEEMMGKGPGDMATPESQKIIAQNVRAGIETPYEVTCIRKDGSTFPCELLGRNTTYMGKPARITGFRDLSERHRLEAEQERREEQVRHAQKLETLGVLAGGIAHDFNNLLTIILANADGAGRAKDNTERRDHTLSQIKNAVARARELTEHLLVYAGQGERKIERVNVSELVEDAIELLRVSVSKKAALRCELAETLPDTEADAGQLRQIAMNLIINASDSLAGNSGEIVVSTGEVNASAQDLSRAFADDSAPGRYVYLEVRDTGAGMSQATLSRLFDPFFTTKTDGRGLGLAAVRGIVSAHKGAIELDSSPGNGTRFRVLLPASETTTTRAQPAGDSQPRLHLRPATVLVAEDEPAIAEVVRFSLEEAGCSVVIAVDGEQAIEKFRGHANAVDLLLLDLTMPKKNGLEVLETIRKLAPKVPAILCSGYTERNYQDVLDGDRHASFLSKPYSLDILLERVHEVLSAAAIDESN